MPLPLLRRPRRVAALAALLAACAPADRAFAPPAAAPRLAAGPGGAATGVVVSQIYGGGANTGAAYQNDYVELFNAGPDAADVTGWSVQYASATGSFNQSAVLAGTIPAGRHYLVRLAAQTATNPPGEPLPEPDASNTGINISATNGKVALVRQAAALGCGTTAATPPVPCTAEQRALVADLVGYGSATLSEGAPAPAASNTLALFRAAGGATDTDDNAADFATGAPAPRNLASGGAPAPVGPLDRVTVAPASPSVEQGGTVTLTAVAEDAEGDDITAGTIVWSDGDSPNVTVTPSGSGRTAVVRGDLVGGPATVTATLTADGVTRSGSASVTVVRPGVSDDIQFSGRTPADLPLPVGFSDQLFANARRNGAPNPGATVASWASENDVATVDQRGVITALRAGTMRIRATLSDGYSEVYELEAAVAQPGDASRYADPLQFGRPADADASDDFPLARAGYAASYNRHTRTPNWTAYNLDAGNKGDISGARCDCFTFDPELRDAGFAEVTTADYTGSGYDRGHMVASDDRELGYLDQAQTYYLSNVVPQNPRLNQGPWAQLEQYLQDSVAIAGNRELFIFTGPAGVTLAGGDTLKAGGKVAVPAQTWKIALVLERDRGLAGVRTASDVVDVIAVLAPNTTPAAGATWRSFRTTVDAVEAATGYDFLAALPDRLEAQLEAAAPPTRPVGMEIAESRVSAASSAAVTAVLLAGPDFDAAGFAPAALRLVTQNGTQVAPVARGGAVVTSTRDVNGDGRPDRVVGFRVRDLRAGGFGPAAPALTLRLAGSGAPAWLAADATPPVVVP